MLPGGSGGGGVLQRRLDALNDGAPEAALALVGDGVLAGRHRTLHGLEGDVQRAIGLRLQPRRLVAWR